MPWGWNKAGKVKDDRRTVLNLSVCFSACGRQHSFPSWFEEETVRKILSSLSGGGRQESGGGGGCEDGAQHTSKICVWVLVVGGKNLAVVVAVRMVPSTHPSVWAAPWQLVEWLDWFIDFSQGVFGGSFLMLWRERKLLNWVERLVPPFFFLHPLHLTYLSSPSPPSSFSHGPSPPQTFDLPFSPSSFSHGPSSLTYLTSPPPSSSFSHGPSPPHIFYPPSSPLILLTWTLSTSHIWPPLLPPHPSHMDPLHRKHLSSPSPPSSFSHGPFPPQTFVLLFSLLPPHPSHMDPLHLTYLTSPPPASSFSHGSSPPHIFDLSSSPLILLTWTLSTSHICPPLLPPHPSHMDPLHLTYLTSPPPASSFSHGSFPPHIFDLSSSPLILLTWTLSTTDICPPLLPLILLTWTLSTSHICPPLLPPHPSHMDPLHLTYLSSPPPASSFSHGPSPPHIFVLPSSLLILLHGPSPSHIFDLPSSPSSFSHGPSPPQTFVLPFSPSSFSHGPSPPHIFVLPFSPLILLTWTLSTSHICPPLLPPHPSHMDPLHLTYLISPPSSPLSLYSSHIPLSTTNICPLLPPLLPSSSFSHALSLLHLFVLHSSPSVSHAPSPSDIYLLLPSPSINHS